MRLLPHEPAKAVRAESSRELCISIGGGAWASLFYLGFLQYLQTQFSRAMLERCAFCGESSGGVYALAACIGMPYEYLQDLCEDLVHDANQHPLGIVGRGLELAGLLVDKVLDYLPEEELVERLRGRFAGVHKSKLGLVVALVLASLPYLSNVTSPIDESLVE